MTGKGNGFKFFDPIPEALAAALERAVSFFRNNTSGWLRIMRNGMQADFSWNASAGQYLALYERAKRLRDRGPLLAQKKACGRFCICGA